jgi:plastocyanin
VKNFTNFLPPARASVNFNTPLNFMKKFLLLFSFGIFAALQLARAGDITGVITLKGTPPPEKNFADSLQGDQNCSALYSGTFPTTHFYAVNADGGLADVVISIKGGDFKSTGASAAPVVLDQKGCLYSPTILAVQTGQKIIVKNSDPCVHNVHAKPTANGEVNQVQMPGGADLTFAFDKPEPFLKFQCDVHPWMFAWVTVVDHPYFAVSDKDGKFTIKNVPPGKYTLEAAHRKLGAQTAEIEVKDSGAAQNFAFEVK